MNANGDTQMAWLTSENRDTFQTLFTEVNKEKPAVGQTVKLISGKRHGKVGIVVKHIRDRYEPYANARQIRLCSSS
jgi:hypothetical protein